MILSTAKKKKCLITLLILLKGYALEEHFSKDEQKSVNFNNTLTFEENESGRSNVLTSSQGNETNSADSTTTSKVDDEGNVVTSSPTSNVQEQDQSSEDTEKNDVMVCLPRPNKNIYFCKSRCNPFPKDGQNQIKCKQKCSCNVLRNFKDVRCKPPFHSTNLERKEKCESGCSNDKFRVWCAMKCKCTASGSTKEESTLETCSSAKPNKKDPETCWTCESKNPDISTCITKCKCIPDPDTVILHS